MKYDVAGYEVAGEVWLFDLLPSITPLFRMTLDELCTLPRLEVRRSDSLGANEADEGPTDGHDEPDTPLTRPRSHSFSSDGSDGDTSHHTTPTSRTQYEDAILSALESIPGADEWPTLEEQHRSRQSIGLTLLGDVVRYLVEEYGIYTPTIDGLSMVTGGVEWWKWDPKVAAPSRGEAPSSIPPPTVYGQQDDALWRLIRNDVHPPPSLDALGGATLWLAEILGDIVDEGLVSSDKLDSLLGVLVPYDAEGILRTLPMPWRGVEGQPVHVTVAPSIPYDVPTHISSRKDRQPSTHSPLHTPLTTLMEQIRSLVESTHIDDGSELVIDVGALRRAYNGAATYMHLDPIPDAPVTSRRGVVVDSVGVQLGVGSEQDAIGKNADSGGRVDGRTTLALGDVSHTALSAISTRELEILLLYLDGEAMRASLAITHGGNVDTTRVDAVRDRIIDVLADRGVPAR